MTDEMDLGACVSPRSRRPGRAVGAPPVGGAACVAGQQQALRCWCQRYGVLRKAGVPSRTSHVHFGQHRAEPGGQRVAVGEVVVTWPFSSSQDLSGRPSPSSVRPVGWKAPEAPGSPRAERHTPPAWGPGASWIKSSWTPMR
jgi:hypothetical protein